MFHKNSGLVKVWVSLIKAGVYTVEAVPALDNLQTVIKEVMKGE